MIELLEFLLGLIRDNETFTLDLITIGCILWIKFNDLKHIAEWQCEHKQRSEEMWNRLSRHGERISHLEGRTEKE